MGQKISTGIFEKEKTSMDLQHLQSGIYFLRIYEKGDLVRVSKVVKV